jgi:hypothetical protein
VDRENVIHNAIRDLSKCILSQVVDVGVDLDGHRRAPCFDRKIDDRKITMRGKEDGGNKVISALFPLVSCSNFTVVRVHTMDSYVVARKSEIRNLQIGTCDLEGNMSPEAPASANILLDSTGSSIGEVAIVGCTIQHAPGAPESANIRILGRSVARPFTAERRHGNITIASNVLSDVQFNLDLRDVRAGTITGNAIWQGYDHNLRIVGSKNIVVSSNVFDRNPRYDHGDHATAKLAVTIRDSQDCIVTGNQLFGTGDIPIAMQLTGCSRIHVNACSIFEYANSGLRLQDCDNCRVTNCMIESSLESAKQGFALRIEGGTGSWQTGNSPGRSH